MKQREITLLFLTPLRYPGGKGKLANYFKLLYRGNGLMDSPYAEIYAGGAGIALSLLFDEYASKVFLNDLNPSIYTFWYSVLNETDALCKLINDTPVTIDEWKRQQIIQNNLNSVSTLELGFSTFFLNRTNRSGIIKGGIIGGKNQNGNYKLDARFNKNDLTFRIQRIARYRGRIFLYKLDAAEFIQKILPTLSQKTLVYLDPPYFIKGQGLYQDYYQTKDHQTISQLVSGIKQKWVVSYDNVPEIMDLYSRYQNITYQLSYSAGDRYKGSEVMFFPLDMIIPGINNPSKVPMKYLDQPALPL